ncbi:hypothetical protein [Methanohalophilus profundi]|uniref:hypothetical protein n=1 Tax=Methanohalophilus profundi TaxID=2138083 RepID=UPI002989B954|nr:hypothetical protein [Methanohalophilus profundi]
MTIDIEPLLDEPALLVKGQSRTLVLSDLHIGIEWDLYNSGFLVPSGLERRLKKIEGYIEQTEPDRIVLLGDIKHNVPQISWQERDEIPMFLENSPCTQKSIFSRAIMTVELNSCCQKTKYSPPPFQR